MCQAISRAISLEAHGYKAAQQLASAANNIVLVIHNPIWPDVRFVAKSFTTGSSTSKDYTGVWQEIQLLKELQHPYVVRYIESWWSDSGPESRRLTVVMEHAENGDLRRPREVMLQHSLFLEETLIKRWLRQMLEGLAYIHSQNVVHRDLKASNMFLKDSWRTCLIGDFGISKVLDTSSLTDTMVGTPAYMAPELLRNEPYGMGVDHWAIGVILYEIITLRQPFNGTSLAAMMFQIAFTEPAAEPLLASPCSEALSALVMKLLCKDAALRPEPMAMLADPGLWEHFCMEGSEIAAVQAFESSTSLGENVLKYQGHDLDEEDDDSWAGAEMLTVNSGVHSTADLLTGALFSSLSSQNKLMLPSLVSTLASTKQETFKEEKGDQGCVAFVANELLANGSQTSASRSITTHSASTNSPELASFESQHLFDAGGSIGQHEDRRAGSAGLVSMCSPPSKALTSGLVATALSPSPQVLANVSSEPPMPYAQLGASSATRLEIVAGQKTSCGFHYGKTSPFSYFPGIEGSVPGCILNLDDVTMSFAS